MKLERVIHRGSKDPVVAWEPPARIREVLYYHPEEIFTRPRSIRQAWMSFKGRRALGVACSSLLGLSASALSAMTWKMFGPLVGSSVIGGDWVNDPDVLLGMLASGALIGTRAGMLWLANVSRDTTIDSIVRRVVAMTSQCEDETLLAPIKKAKGIASRRTDTETLVRLDAIALSLGTALDKAGPDKDASHRARLLAERAIASVVASVDDEGDEVASVDPIRTLERICGDVSSDLPICAIAPTPRIARALSLAERALATHPDMVDAGGARIDHLVQKHVPRLLALRNEALSSASVERMESVDRAFSAAFDGVVSSIEEGIASIHDETMERLSTEMRFLSIRSDRSPERTTLAS